MQKKKKFNLIFWLKIAGYIIAGLIGTRIIFAARTAPNMFDFNAILAIIMQSFLPSFHPYDIFGGAVISGGVWFAVWCGKKNKKLRIGREHGSAEWGTAKDMEPFTDFENPNNNIILTQTEWLTMGVGNGALDRNKNVLVIGAPGTGKTLFFVKPELMQMYPKTSYVLTDPKGSVLLECGSMLYKKGYKIKIFNTFDFSKSMHYNPFEYFRDDTFTEDIETFITMFQEQTGEKESTGDKFFPGAEKLLYKACIGVIFTIFPKKDRNINTLCTLITNLTATDEETGADGKPRPKPSKTEIIFMAMEAWLKSKDLSKFKGFNFTKPPTERQKEIGEYALDNYKRFRQGAGKTMKSILISCSVRLSVFDSKAVRRVISKDDLELHKIGDEKTAFFIITDDSDPTFNFLAAIMYAQLFKLLFKRAADFPDNKLRYHVRFVLDEFANLGKIPTFENKISVFRSRNISCSIILQAMSQLKAMYKDNNTHETIITGCESQLFLGSAEITTLKWLSEMIGKETIDTKNYSLSKGGHGSYTTSDQKTGRELITVDELRRLDGRQCILLIRGIKPFKSMKYDIKGHKNYPLLGTVKNKRLFDVKGYLGDFDKKLPVTDDGKYVRVECKGEK